jgi:hypothetical protein
MVEHSDLYRCEPSHTGYEPAILPTAHGRYAIWLEKRRLKYKLPLSCISLDSLFCWLRGTLF